jgi:hypothetical protein
VRHRWKTPLSLGLTGVAHCFYDMHQSQLVHVKQNQLEQQAAPELVKNQ